MKVAATILVFALCALDHYASAGSKCAIEENTKNNKVSFNKKHVANVGECADWCNKEPQCKYWTFKKSTWGWFNKNCYLQDGNDDRVEDNGWTSGSKSCEKASCKTKKGNQCVFPFKYKNVLYTSCTRRGGGLLGMGLFAAPWCSTEVDQDGNYNGVWGECGDCSNAGSKCAIEDNTRNMRRRLKEKHTATSGECADWCAKEPRCEYWTWAKEGTWTFNLFNHNCYLMDGNEDRKEDRGWISGSKSCDKITCKTEKGKKCVFPFKYKNVLYTECTRRGGGLFGTGLFAAPWCSTGVDGNGNYNGAWGKCGECLTADLKPVKPAPPKPDPVPDCGCGTVTKADNGCQCGTARCQTGQRCVQGQCKATDCRQLKRIPMAKDKNTQCMNECRKTYCNGGCQSYNLNYGYSDENKNGCFLSSCPYKG